MWRRIFFPLKGLWVDMSPLVRCWRTSVQEPLCWITFPPLTWPGLAIQNGLVLAIEAAEGTDACILRTQPLIQPQEYPPLYIKRCKVNQTEKIDLLLLA